MISLVFLPVIPILDCQGVQHAWLMGVSLASVLACFVAGKNYLFPLNRICLTASQHKCRTSMDGFSLVAQFVLLAQISSSGNFLAVRS